jgi:hypothetical protein
MGPGSWVLAAIGTIASTGIVVYVLGNFGTVLNEYRKCRANVSDIGNAFNNYIAKRRTLTSPNGVRCLRPTRPIGKANRF